MTGTLGDGDSRTVWSTATEGAYFTVSSFDFSISSLGIQLPKSKDFARPKKIKVSIQGVSQTFDLEDKSTMKWIMVPPVMGYTGGGFGEDQFQSWKPMQGPFIRIKWPSMKSRPKRPRAQF